MASRFVIYAVLNKQNDILNAYHVPEYVTWRTLASGHSDSGILNLGAVFFD